MECPVCSCNSNLLFVGTILKKHLCHYYKCSNCGFIYTEKPYWLEEAYSNVITNLDVGLVARNIMYCKIVERLILQNFQYKSKFLDFAGGYGLLVRMMRDRGFDFYRQDKYCTNLFARNFDINDLFAGKTNFEMLTAFEVFEHLEFPLEELEYMLKYSENILFSTELVPEKNITSENDWWYFAPETGQHIAFYTHKSLSIIANKYGLNFYSNRLNLHLFTKKKLKKNPFDVSMFSLRYRVLPFFYKMIDRWYKSKKGVYLESKTQQDYFLLKNK